MTNVTDPKLEIELRKLTLADIGPVVRLEKVIFPDPWSSAAFKEQLTVDGFDGILAECDGEIIGYACWYTVAGESHLTNIAVEPKYRRKSVAKQLLGNILQVVTDNNCEYMFLEVRPSNTEAIAFYKRHQFEVMYRRPDYYRQPVEDALVMGKYLAGPEKDQHL